MLGAVTLLSGSTPQGIKKRQLNENLVAFLIREIYLRRMEDACI